MATSSITKNFVISGKERVEALADAIEVQPMTRHLSTESVPGF